MPSWFELCVGASTWGGWTLTRKRSRGHHLVCKVQLFRYFARWKVMSLVLLMQVWSWGKRTDIVQLGRLHQEGTNLGLLLDSAVEYICRISLYRGTRLRRNVHLRSCCFVKGLSFLFFNRLRVLFLLYQVIPSAFARNHCLVDMISLRDKCWKSGHVATDSPWNRVLVATRWGSLA